VHGVHARAAGAVFVQGAGLLPELRRPAHDRERGSAGGRGAAAGARAPVGAEPAVPSAVLARVGSRAGAGGARLPVRVLLACSGTGASSCSSARSAGATRSALLMNRKRS
jgi:hypothetical protein